MKSICLFTTILLLFLISTGVQAQHSVTEVITDFGGYWKSSSVAINSTKPNNSHNLLSFTYDSKRFSTGVNDAMLTSNGQSFIAGDFRALPMHSITGTVNGNTKIGLGELYDGVGNGASTHAPENNIPKYLNDGIKGLDIGTCVANLPAGNMFFPIAGLKISAIGDAIPDLVITQTADPSPSALDRYEFTDINGNIVGNAVNIVLNNILPVGNWTADFYSANTSPMSLAGGYTRTDRPLRLWAADFSSFGINASNVSQVAYFRITLSGTSDVAFVAYNYNTFDVDGVILPINLKSFTASVKHDQVGLDWKTVSEMSSSKFIIEVSNDGNIFKEFGSVAAAGNSDVINSYHHKLSVLVPGNYFIRLKMVDVDGYFTFSTVQKVQVNTSNSKLDIYPNPATNFIIANHPQAKENQFLQVFNAQGMLVLQTPVKAGTSQTHLRLSPLVKGIYHVRWADNATSKTISIAVQ